MNNIFDSHSHYTFSGFDHDRDELLKALPEKGVKNVITVGTDLEDSVECVKLAEQYDYIYASCGVHPESEEKIYDGFCDDLEKLLKSSKKVKALGEIGLDYHYDNYNKERQIKMFEEQLELAESLKLPVIIHSREATEDMLKILRKYRPKGVMHCFSGSAETAKEVVSLGLYVSFTGVLTFKNAKKAQSALMEVPLDRLMFETDCPFMAPEPFRRNRCDSSMISRIAEKAGELLGKDPQELLDITYRNACEFFEI